MADIDATAGEDAASPVGTLVRASEGGVVRSEDGVFELWIGPGGIEEDTTISITRVDRADLPADLAALAVASDAYLVEPDGLTFAPDGAFAHFILDEIPASVAAGESLVGVSRPSGGGPIEQIEATVTASFAPDRTQVLYPIAHLSYQVLVDALGCMTLGVDLGDEMQIVGRPWRTALDIVNARALEGSGPVSEMVAHGGVVRARPQAVDLLDGLGGAPDRFLGFNLPAYLDSVQFNHSDISVYVAEARSIVLTPRALLDGSGETRGWAASVDAQSAYRFVCTEAGNAEIFLGARAQYEPLAGAASFTSQCQPFAAQVVRCWEEPNIDFEVLRRADCRREGSDIVCSDAVVTPVATVRPTDTTRVTLPGSRWRVATYSGTGERPMGPERVTVSDGVNEVVATRSATGEYDWSSVDLSRWTGPTRDWTVEERGRFFAAPLEQAPEAGCRFAQVEGLDTDIVCDADRAPVDLDVRIVFGDPVTCRGELSEGLTISGVLVETELSGGVSGLDAPIRDAVEATATHCAIPVSTLTAGEWHIELGARSTHVIDAATPVSVSSGAIMTLDGAALTTTCSGRFSLFCTDRCVDPLLDPMNCGACGRVGVEVCNDMADNDCNYYVDDGCPNRIDWGGGGDSDTSGMIGDVVSASDGSIGHGCAYFTPFTGLCGNASSDGTVRGLSAICGSVRLVPTGPDAFDVEVTESYPGGVACEMATFPLGGSPVAARCPRNMIADGVFGAAPSSGNLGQVGVSCSQWDVVRDPALGWVIRRVSSGVSPTIGSGPGMPFSSYMVSDHSTLGTPGALRQLRGRYRGVAPAMMPGGVLWFSVAGSPPILTLN